MTREQFIYNVQATQKSLRTFLVALCCGDGAMADDIAQDSLVKAYLAIDSCREPDRFKSWLFSIAYNTFLSTRRAIRPVTVDVDAASHVAAEATDGFRYQELYMALSQLSAKERASILLYYLEGYSIKEVARLTQSTEAAVKQHLSRGRNHLRQILTSQKTL